MTNTHCSVDLEDISSVTAGLVHGAELAEVLALTGSYIYTKHHILNPTQNFKGE